MIDEGAKHLAREQFLNATNNMFLKNKNKQIVLITCATCVRSSIIFAKEEPKEENTDMGLKVFTIIIFKTNWRLLIVSRIHFEDILIVNYCDNLLDFL